MKVIESWVLRIADSDRTWIGLGWLRPSKHQRLGYDYVLFSSLLLSLPGIAVCAGLIWYFLGNVEPRIWLMLFLITTTVELLLHGLFARYWNRRASTLAASL
jgi:hypothetical protein